MKRRDFLGIAACATANGAAPKVIERGGWRLELDAKDNIVSLRKGSLELIDPRGAGNRPQVGGRASADYAVDLIDLGGGAVAVKQTVTVSAASKAGEQITLDLPRCIRLPVQNRTAFLPLFQGIGWRGPADNELQAGYTVAGGHGMKSPRRLAIPLIEESSPKSSLRIAYCTDAFFSAGIGDSFRWEYSDKVPPPDHHQREAFTILHSGAERDAIDRFYQTALRSVHKGPEWLHQIALVDYDYLSKSGAGWFRDIDTLEKVIPRPDRAKVLLVLHGWYGYIGRYTYDPRTQSLAKQWTAFPEAQSPGVQKLVDKYNPKNPYSWQPEAIRALRPVQMSLAEMHRRIRYAKDRGFRVALYFGDGIAACEGLKDIFDPSKVLRWGGWTLPDTLGKYYVQNPIHPGVVSFFKGYMQALLAEYGRDVDAFVWDETFLVTSEDLGTREYPGYASRAMMRLVESLSVMVQQYGPELAFLTSDNLGLKNHDAAYALAAHGNYQDSAMAPVAWDYGLFPNFRNVMWSCNWAPIRLLDRTRYAAEVFDVPVSLSNGYGEDLGVSEMTRYQLKMVMDVFERRKSRRMDITWIEDTGGKLAYKGRPVTPRPA